jgi:chromosome partitioning protein
VISIAGADDLHKVVVLNPKGGCGKTTLATNLAAFYALRGPPPTLIDCDPQGFSLRWLTKRAPERPRVHALRGYVEAQTPVEVDGVLEVPRDSNLAIVDLPAAIPQARLHVYVHLADSLLLPIQPSEIDVYGAARFIADLLLVAQLDRRTRKLAIVANRVRMTTRSYRMLARFLGSLHIPLIASLRDSQNFVQAAAEGIGVAELPPHRTRDDLPALEAIVRWLDKRRAVTAAQRDEMIARAAYRQAEERGFAPGDPLTDWLNAEREVDDWLEREAG